MIKKIIIELFHFWIKQAKSSIFWGLLLFFILLTNFYYPFENFYRYDFLFLIAILIQFFLVLFKIETLKEVKIIFIFHILATLMEIFKTSDSIQSWNYPWEAIFIIWNVPLFTGFMYSAIWSYILKSWKYMKLNFTNYPNLEITFFIAFFSYLNFFTHHFIFDVRWILFFIILFYFYKTKIYFIAHKKERNMPFLVWFWLVTFFIRIAENLSTFAGLWLYPDQINWWQTVSFQKFWSWYLLFFLSFVIVSLEYKNKLKR